MSVSNIYEKMLQNPENRKRSFIKQPTPFDGHDKVVPKKTVNESDIDADDAFFKAVDSRMSRKKGKSNTSNKIENNINNIEVLEEEIELLKNRVKELEELVTTVMKTHMKLIKKLK